jgi:DNA-binding transcriptional regulator YhcF (GntR family)
MNQFNEMKKDQKPIEYRSYTDNETGEIYTVPVMNHYGKGNKDFEMIFYGHLLEILNDLGNKRILVLQHIIKNREKANNTFIGTVRDVANALNISPVTVNNTLVLLEDKGAIKRKTGVVYIDADLICDGRFKNHIMHVYNEVEEELTPEAKNAKIIREIKRKEAELEDLKKKIPMDEYLFPKLTARRKAKEGLKNEIVHS